jgi:hypothetical protein
MTAKGSDHEVEAVVAELFRIDPDGSRTARVLRETLDQLYHGQKTGRYRWDQLRKTEKTHCGTIVEINLHREFAFDDGEVLDYRIAGIEVDCKYSQTLGGWMIPPEARDQICLVVWADDYRSIWQAGVIRTTDELLRGGENRDKKVSLNVAGMQAVRWLWIDAPLPPNVLLQLPEEDVSRIMRQRSGAARVRELFRTTLGMQVGRAVVATVAQQADYMKRVRKNGGARSSLRAEGIVILGQYQSHVAIAHSLGVAEPGPGESVAVRLTPVESAGTNVAWIDGGWWRESKPQDAVVAAPLLPDPTRTELRRDDN